MTVNLDESAYEALLAIAKRQDVPVAQVARNAVVAFLRREEPSFGQRVLQLSQPTSDRGGPVGG